MTYQNMQAIAYVINTAPLTNPNGSQSYLGLQDPLQDIDMRCQLMSRAMVTARAQIDPAVLADANTLKIFMVPEFYFRGVKGAYDMDAVQYAITQLQKLVSDDLWKDWLFVCGTIVGMSVAESAVAPTETYNFSLVQPGGISNAGSLSARVVMKEMMSGIDFVADSENPDGLLLGEVTYLAAGSSGPGRERQILNYDGAGMFSLAGISWALEICLDHLEGRLQKAPQLPGEQQIQMQLIPSCGMSIQADQVIASEHGYAFNCDGLDNGSSLIQVNLLGSPPQKSLVNIAQSGSVALSNDPLTSNTSPPTAIAIDQLFQSGAGKINLYPVQILPLASEVPGTILPLTWKLTDDYSLVFQLIYNAQGMYNTITCQIKSNDPKFKNLQYFTPLMLDTQDRLGNPIKFHLSNKSGPSPYWQSIWCDITVPGFIFEGNAFCFFKDIQTGAPRTIW